MDLDRLVLRDGIRVAAFGRVVALGEECWFDPPLPIPLVLYAPGAEPAPRPSGVGVRVEGVDLERISERRSKDGATEGWARLGGVWREDRLIVDEQGVDADGAPDLVTSWTVPPCAPPVGGWPRGEIDHDSDLWEGADEIIAVTMFRPSSRRVVAVIASDDPALTRSRLGARLGNRLCVVPSRWTRAQVAEVRAQLHAHFDDWALFESGESASSDGQLEISIQVVRVLPALADFAAGVPEGLLVVDPWLVPEPRSPGLDTD